MPESMPAGPAHRLIVRPAAAADPGHGHLYLAGAASLAAWWAAQPDDGFFPSD